MIEAGVRFVTVNMFETAFDEITWDITDRSPSARSPATATSSAPTMADLLGETNTDMAILGLRLLKP